MRAVLDESLESDLSEHEIITIYRTFRSRPPHSLVNTSVVYHRERIWFSSTLSCIKEKEEITKPPRGLSPCLPSKQQGRALP